MKIQAGGKIIGSVTHSAKGVNSGANAGEIVRSLTSPNKALIFLSGILSVINNKCAFSSAPYLLLQLIIIRTSY